MANISGPEDVNIDKQVESTPQVAEFDIRKQLRLRELEIRTQIKKEQLEIKMQLKKEQL